MQPGRISRAVRSNSILIISGAPLRHGMHALNWALYRFMPEIPAKQLRDTAQMPPSDPGTGAVTLSPGIAEIDGAAIAQTARFKPTAFKAVSS